MAKTNRRPNLTSSSRGALKRGAAPTTQRGSVPISPILLIDLYFPTVACATAIDAFPAAATFTCRNVHFIAPQ